MFQYAICLENNAGFSKCVLLEMQMSVGFFRQIRFYSKSESSVSIFTKDTKKMTKTDLKNELKI